MSQFNIKGTYVFKQNGVEVGRSSNIVTESGKQMIMQYLCGLRKDWATDLAIGALTSTPVITDTQLTFETGRYPVTLKSFIMGGQNDPNMIVIRATLPANLYANIYEVGVYPSSADTNVANRSNKIITDFSDYESWSQIGEVSFFEFLPQAEHSPRIGSNSVTLDVSSSITNNVINTSFEDYTEVDTIDILVYNTLAGIVSITFSSPSGETINLAYQLTTSSGYQKISATLPPTVRNWNAVSSIIIATDETASLTIDCIKASDVLELPLEQALVSKSSLSEPIAKIYGVPLDVEYYLELV